jgi:hypothetical protein
VDNPCKTINHVIAMVRPGDVVMLRGGTYYQHPSFKVAGAADAPITYESYPGERAVLSGAHDGHNGSNPSTRKYVAWVQGDWQVFRNLDITQGSIGGLYLTPNGSPTGTTNHIVLDGVHAYLNEGPGVVFTTTDDSLIENCVFYGNADMWNPTDPGNNGDGLHFDYGNDNIIRNNLAYNNSDDGIDVWQTSNSTVEYNISHDNGYDLSGNPYVPGNLSNGYKLGKYHNSAGGGHKVIGNISYHNTGFGFMDNATTYPSPTTVYNNTSYDDSTAADWGRGFSFGGYGPHDIMVNNLGVPGPDSKASPMYDQNKDLAESETNSWDLGITSADFISTDPSSPNFLRLASNSPAVAAGTDVGLSYSGSAPDLGAIQDNRSIADIGPQGSASVQLAGR